MGFHVNKGVKCANEANPCVVAAEKSEGVVIHANAATELQSHCKMDTGAKITDFEDQDSQTLTS
jgi:hypothetical protein